MSPAHGRFLSRLVPALAAGSLKWPAPRTLVHGDLSAKNVFFVDAGGATRVVMFDWQLVAHGHPARDAATLINRSLPPDAWARDATCLLRFYFEALVGAGVRGFSFEELLDTYRRVSLIQMATAVNIGGGIAEPDPARVSIVRRSLERAPVILDSFDVDQYLS